MKGSFFGCVLDLTEADFFARESLSLCLGDFTLTFMSLCFGVPNFDLTTVVGGWD
jgi:hypothetical protein